MGALGRRTLARAAARLNAASRWAGRVPSLALMTDDERLPDAVAAARALPRGSLVVLRARDAARREKLAAAMSALAASRGLVLLIASDPGLAVRIRADGLHLPEARVRETPHWRARHPGWFIGAAAHSLAAAASAARSGADVVFLAPVFATKSHPGGAPLSPARANLIASQLRIPVYALGGIDVRNAASLSSAFAGIAAVGALAV